MEQQPIRNTSPNNFIRWIVMGVLVILCVATGAIVMCKHSGGEIETANWTCNQLKVVGLCEKEPGMNALLSKEQAAKLNLTLNGVFLE